MEQELIWKANSGQQELALRIPSSVFEELYGGARGGGKTDAGIHWIVSPGEDTSFPVIEIPKFRGLVIRKNSDDLSDWIDRAQRVYVPEYGAKLVKHPHVYFQFPHGSVIRCGHLKDKDAYTKYQGHEYQRLLIEELTQIPREDDYEKLIASCRSTVDGVRPQVFATTNPGGKGHAWVKRRFIDPRITNRPFNNPRSGRLAIFIPAKIDDNPVLMEKDPDYIKMLEAYKTTNPDLYKAWRHGDWEIFTGQAFPEFMASTHVINRMPVDLKYCKKVCTLDWGYTDPCSIHWLAYMPENKHGVRHTIVYREAYANQKTPRAWAQLLCKIFKYEMPDELVLPADVFHKRLSETSIASIFKQEFQKAGLNVNIVKADTSSGSRVQRVNIMHDGLSISPDGMPYLLFMQNCPNLIRTLPELIMSETKVEDIEDDQEDHAFDSVTYGYRRLKPAFGHSLNVWQKDRSGNVSMRKSWQTDDNGAITPGAGGDILKQIAGVKSNNHGEPEK